MEPASGTPGQTATRLLAAIVQSSDDAIISKTVDGTVTSWNNAATRIFGYSADEMIGRSISVISTAGRVGEMSALLARILRGEQINHFEAVRRHKDGSTVHVSLSISPICDEYGTIVGAAKIARDIGAAKASADALKVAHERLRIQRQEMLHATRLADLGMMAATLAHEINQPLAALSNYLMGCQKLLSQDHRDDAVLFQVLRQASGQVLRASGIIQHLRAYARPNEGVSSPEPIAQIVAETTALATIDAGQRGILIHLSNDLNQTLVQVVRIELQQVLLNLIRNAFEAMADQERRELWVSSRAVGDMVEIKVIDTGTGIDLSMRDRLFQPFATTKADGMGIGLSICSKIVEAHGGRIWVEEANDGSTAFVFTVPIAANHAIHWSR